MMSRFGGGFAILGLLSLAIYMGCDRQPSRVQQASLSPSGISSKAMELLDANKDGKIAGPELDKAPGLKAALKVMKTDATQGVTAEQISGRVDKWIESKIGRQTVSCMVTRNGQPLANANVVFVPETFMKDVYPTSPKGTTNANGMAMISLPTTPGPDGDPPGMGPGMYRVEITKTGDNIPAQYNTNTTLGQEISLDNIDLQMGIKFPLKY